MYESLEDRLLLTANVEFTSIQGVEEPILGPVAADVGGGIVGLTWGDYSGNGDYAFAVKRSAPDLDRVWEQSLLATYETTLFFDLTNGQMEADSSGFVYFAALVRAPDLPVTPDAVQANLLGEANYYLAILDGNQIDDDPTSLSSDELVYATYFGGSEEQHTNSRFGLGVNSDGDVFIAGRTRSGDFPTTSQPHVDSTLGIANDGTVPSDGFLTKFAKSEQGYSLAFSSYVGGVHPDGFTGLSIDPAGIVHVSGRTSSADFPYAANAIARPDGTDAAAILMRFSPQGEILYSTALATKSDGSGTVVVASDGSGASYVATSIFQSDIGELPLSSDAFQKRTDKEIDERTVYVTKIDSNADFEFGTLYGGTTGNDEVIEIAVDGDEAIVVGTTFSTQLPVDGTQDVYGGGNDDGFVVKFNSEGTDILGATYLGGDDSDRLHSVSIADGSLWIAGETSSTDLPTTDGSTGTGRFLAQISFGSSPPHPGDANGDDEVDFADFLVLSKNFGKQADAIFAEGDFDGNGAIEFADFLILSANFGRSR